MVLVSLSRALIPDKHPFSSLIALRNCLPADQVFGLGSVLTSKYSITIGDSSGSPESRMGLLGILFLCSWIPTSSRRKSSPSYSFRNSDATRMCSFSSLRSMIQLWASFSRGFIRSLVSPPLFSRFLRWNGKKKPWHTRFSECSACSYELFDFEVIVDG